MSKTVPYNVCRQCGLCCKLFYINLNEAEYKSKKFETVFRKLESIEKFSEAQKCGANFLAQKEDSSCIYLENNLCSIHKDRPYSCRAFFCDLKSKKYEKMRKMLEAEVKLRGRIPQS